MKYKVAMICREVSRAVVIVDTGSSHASEDNLEDVKDKAWAQFDEEAAKKVLEQENHTKIELLDTCEECGNSRKRDRNGLHIGYCGEPCPPVPS